MRALVRFIILIPLAYIAASIAAGMVVVLSFYDFAGHPDFAMEGFIIGAGMVAGAYFGAFAIVPALILIVLAEAFAWRSFLLHVAAGGAIALGVMFVHQQTFTSPPAKAGVMLACGFVGGAIYWLIAGRKSGRGSGSNPDARPETAP